MKSEPMYDVVIVGGGLVGCSFALDLTRQRPDFKICIIDQHEFNFKANSSGWDNKIYALTPHNFLHLEKNLNVEVDQQRVCNINHMHVRGNQNSVIEFSKSATIAGYLAKIVESRNLHQALVKQLTQHANLEFKTVAISEIKMAANSVTIQTENKQTFTTQLLIAADGANSSVRERFDFKVEQVPYYQSGVVANFKCQLPHNNVAHQWLYGDGILAYLPLPEQQISIVWATNDFAHLLSCSDKELCQQVANAGEQVLGQLTLVTRPQAFPLKLNLVNKFYQQRVILIGDAAHTLHPLAGQGLNLGLGDAWELAALISGLNLQHFDPLALARYNFSRMAEVRKMQLTCHLLQRLFQNRLPVVNQLRNLGLNVLNQLPLLKQSLINSAVNF